MATTLQLGAAFDRLLLSTDRQGRHPSALQRKDTPVADRPCAAYPYDVGMFLDEDVRSLLAARRASPT